MRFSLGSKTGAVAFNPYSTGRYSMSNKEIILKEDDVGLNPYSTGRYSMRI
jgi:hypothetical protein